MNQTTTTAPALAVEQIDDSLVFSLGERELTRYVFAPDDDQFESPRPYFHPINTLEGDLVSIYRPWDHIWHKGLSWTLPNVGEHNFWGGATYTRETGYANLPNNGAMRHGSFGRLEATDDHAEVVESLTWTSQAGRDLITEERAFRVGLDEGSWSILFETTMTNVSGEDIPIGSPTTEGRPNAGYGGLFWRGPRSFTGGTIHVPGTHGTDELMGTRSPWIAFTGQHDESCRFSSLAFAEDPGNLGAPNQWFARSGIFGCLGSAPFFSEVVPLESGGSVSYRYGVAIADGAVENDGAARLGEGLLSALADWTR